MNFLRHLGLSLLFIVLCIALAIGARVLWIGNVAENSARGVITRTLDSDNVLQNYEWFLQTRSDYASAAQNVKVTRRALKEAQSGPRSEESFEEKEHQTQLESTLQGQIQYANVLASQYNARSSMQNRALFKAHDLPASLPLLQ